jgi:hypothetical protein
MTAGRSGGDRDLVVSHAHRGFGCPASAPPELREPIERSAGPADRTSPAHPGGRHRPIARACEPSRLIRTELAGGATTAEFVAASTSASARNARAMVTGGSREHGRPRCISSGGVGVEVEEFRVARDGGLTYGPNRLRPVAAGTAPSFQLQALSPAGRRGRRPDALRDVGRVEAPFGPADIESRSKAIRAHRLARAVVSACRQVFGVRGRSASRGVP